MLYPALLPLIRTPRLPVVDWTDASADLNRLVRFAERRNLVSARVPSHFKRSLPQQRCVELRNIGPYSRGLQLETGRKSVLTDWFFVSFYCCRETLGYGCKKFLICVGNTVQYIWNVMANAQKPDFVFRRNGRVHLNRRRVSVQSTTGSQGVRISSSNAGYTMFQGSVKCTGYPFHSPVSLSLLPCVIVCHHISTGLYCSSV
jgi:hypothetical protein